MVFLLQDSGTLSMFIVLISLGIDILGLTVNGDDCRVVQFREETQNRILAKHVIRSEQVLDKDVCEMKCYLEPNCVSYNYGPLEGGTFICELSNKTHLQVSSSDLEHKDDYIYSPIVNSCESSPCASHSTCQAGFGNHGYRCVCPDGYQGGHCQTDVDECTTNKHDCSNNGDCVNAMGSYQCTCKPGFTGDGRTCQDVDECTMNKHNCSSYGDCANAMGSYQCTCNPGFTGDGRTCQDVDECAMDKHNCSSDGDCANVMGSYQCTCNPGFTGDGRTCQDVDECITNKHDCSSDGNCTNTMGSYQCTCNPGFTGDGRTCQDVDECALNKHDCSSDGNCTNSMGSYQCRCKTGFSGDGRTCQDVDECNDGSHNCHLAAICTNTVGSFGCSCKSGHLGDGRHFCSDNWKKVNDNNPICFGTRRGDYGPFSIREAGQIYTFKLVHTSGSVTCDRSVPYTKWGCTRSEYGTHNLLTVITYSNRTVLPLAQFLMGSDSKYYTYQLDGADVNSQTLVFNLLPNPMDVSVGQQFQIWYGHDLVDYTENNNAGRTCADVYALYPLN